MRNSQVITKQDAAGPYETEIFDCRNPKSVVIGVHGNGVRRWDGENFFYNVAEHYPDRAFLLVDQCQSLDNGCQLNDLATMTNRVQDLVSIAKEKYPEAPIIILAHSMGCGVTTRLNLDDVAKVIFVAPATGDIVKSLVEKYGSDVVDGKLIKTSDGLTKMYPKAYVQSAQGIIWDDEYRKLLEHYQEVYAFESGQDEILSETRFVQRDMPFASYKIIPGAKHNYAGEPLQLLFSELDTLL